MKEAAGKHAILGSQQARSIGKRWFLSLLDFIAHAGSGHVQPRSSHGLYFVVFETLTDVQGGAQHIQSTCFAGSAAFAILESLVDSEPRCEALETRTNGGGLAVRNIQIGVLGADSVARWPSRPAFTVETLTDFDSSESTDLICVS